MEKIESRFKEKKIMVMQKQNLTQEKLQPDHGI